MTGFVVQKYILLPERIQFSVRASRHALPHDSLRGLRDGRDADRVCRAAVRDDRDSYPGAVREQDEALVPGAVQAAPDVVPDAVPAEEASDAVPAEEASDAADDDDASDAAEAAEAAGVCGGSCAESSPEEAEEFRDRPSARHC